MQSGNTIWIWPLLTSLGCAALAPAAETIDRTSLALELALDGNLDDSSPSHITCTPQGEITFVQGRRGKCASFDGSAWIDTQCLQEDLGEEFTVECWVLPADRQNPHADIFGNHVGEGLGFVLQQDSWNTNQFMAAHGIGNAEWVTTDTTLLASGRWRHVAMVKTRETLRLHVNGVLVAEEHDTPPAQPSPTPVAIGLGYSDPSRCFRGLIDEFRIWNKALTDFGHADIDAAEAREILAQRLTDTPREAACALVESWTLNTDDTRVTLGVTSEGQLVVSELACPATGWNWIDNPVAIDLFPWVEVAGQRRTPLWRFVEMTSEEEGNDQRKMTLRFACDDPALEVESQWTAHSGPGPVHHNTFITNRSPHSVLIGDQPTFDLDLSGATDLWRFHSDGITPDPVGVYRHPLAADQPGSRYRSQTTPTGQFIPYVVLDANQRHGVYMGLEWSFCRIEAITLSDGPTPTVRMRGGGDDARAKLAPGETFQSRPGFLGAYQGDLDDAGNSLRRWLMAYCVPEVLRRDPGYPKVQWNAFGATGKSPGSWDPVEAKYYPLIDDIAPLGFEEVMIDVAWWQGDEPDSDSVDWPSGMRKAADYAHEKGLRFGLYWTDDLDMADPEARRRRADRIRRLFQEYDADMWRSDCTRGEVIGASHAATRGFYSLVDMLSEEIPAFQWENCSGGGRIKDYGAMRRSVKIFNSDTYSPLHVRQAFHDSSYALHPIQLEGHLGSVDGRYRPRGAAGMRYAFRSTSLGSPEWFLDAPNGGNGSPPWTEEEKNALKACVETYKAKIRPLVRSADLYHILPRPDGRSWDGIEYYDPAAGRGVVCLFKPSSETPTEVIRFKGLDAGRMYRVRFQDGSGEPSVSSAEKLTDDGLHVTLKGAEVSELVFFELVP